MKDMPKIIIFDFDGTIADSFSFMLLNMHQLIRRPPPKDDISRLRGMSSRELLHELKIPLWWAFFLAARVRRFMSSHIDEITLFPGMDATFRELSTRYDLYIVSSNSRSNVLRFLERHDLDVYFSGVQGGVAPWRKGHALRRLARSLKLVPQDTWYVGDGDLDIKATHRVGMKAVAVAWGFSNIHVLNNCHPEVLVFNSDELTRHFMK
jgi:phosphoglycolate phosphatase